MTLEGAIDAMKMKGACHEKTWPFNRKRVNKKPPGKAESKCK
jgi:hypothetical protein